MLGAGRLLQAVHGWLTGGSNESAAMDGMHTHTGYCDMRYHPLTLPPECGLWGSGFEFVPLSSRFTDEDDEDDAIEEEGYENN